MIIQCRHLRRAIRALGAVTVALTFAQGAGAQSVTLYGVADAGVVLSRSDAPGARTAKALASGIASASRWGLRGTEDLGDGLKAIFQLEAGFDLDTGTATAYAGNPSTATPTSPNGTSGTGFNRRSFVGLETRFGTVTLGRDYTPFFYSALGADIFRLGLFGNLQAMVQPAGGSERFARVSNAIFYDSPLFAGVKARATYSLGSESAGGAGQLPRDANRFLGVGADYTMGGLFVTASYQELKVPLVAGSPAAFTGSTQRRKDALIGARYDIGDFAMTGGYWKMGAPQSATDAWLGASMKFGLGMVLVQVQRLEQDNPAGADRKGTALGLAYLYALSKRTSLYASYGTTRNNLTASFAVTSNSATFPAGRADADPSALALGMRHTF